MTLTNVFSIPSEIYSVNGTLFTRIELDLSRRIQNYHSLRDGHGRRDAPIEYLAVAKSVMVQVNTGKRVIWAKSFKIIIISI